MGGVGGWSKRSFRDWLQQSKRTISLYPYILFDAFLEYLATANQIIANKNEFFVEYMSGYESLLKD